VRVTIEGEVETGAPAKGFRVSCVNDSEIPGWGHYNWFHPGFDGVTIEKLADPEPKWVNGDVILGADANPIARIGGIWLEVANHYQIMDHEVSPKWAKGDIEILYKHDAQTEVA
jgi:hypothetical protein